MKRAVHFVGFKHPALDKDPRYENARKVFGDADFVHRYWDGRAVIEIFEGDVVVFAKGDETQPVQMYSYDDSDQF